MQHGDDGALPGSAHPQTLLPSWTASLSVDKVLLLDVVLLLEEYQTQSSEVRGVKWEGWIIGEILTGARSV